jgi:anti-sigma B factor antagonist
MICVETQGAVDVIDIEGVLNAESLEELHRVTAPSLGRGVPMLVVDLGEVPLIDSCGLEGLLDLRDAAEQRGGNVKLVGLNKLCADIMKVTGLDKQFEILSDAKRGVGSFAK